MGVDELRKLIKEVYDLYVVIDDQGRVYDLNEVPILIEEARRRN